MGAEQGIEDVKDGEYVREDGSEDQLEQFVEMV